MLKIRNNVKNKISWWMNGWIYVSYDKCNDVSKYQKICINESKTKKWMNLWKINNSIKCIKN